MLFQRRKNKVRASESYGFCAESLYKPRWQMYDKSTSKKHFLTTPKMMKMYKSSVASAADHTINPRSTFWSKIFIRSLAFNEIWKMKNDSTVFYDWYYVVSFSFQNRTSWRFNFFLRQFLSMVMPMVISLIVTEERFF